jgi:hypothetical protein
MPLPKYLVRRTTEERTELEDLIHSGKRAASVLIHARIALEADVGDGGPGWDDARSVEAVECGASTGYRVRQALVEEGLPAALFRKKPTGAGSSASSMAPKRPTGSHWPAARPPQGGRPGPCGGWPTGGSNWRWSTRSARNACGRR